MSYWTVLLDTYDRKDSTDEQKSAVVKAIFELLGKFEDEGGLEDPALLMRIFVMCCSEIGRSPVKNEVVPCMEKWGMAFMMYVCLRIPNTAALTSSVISLIINGDGIIEWICNGIESEDEREHTENSYLLARIFDHATEMDRMTLCVRHSNRFREAAFLILTRNDVMCGDYFNSLHMAAFLAMEPTRFARLMSKWTERNCDHRKYCHQRDVCDAILYVLESALESPKTLEALLGYGLLWVAHHFALSTNPHGSAETAHVFRSILEKFPGWKRQFREWTKDGIAGNPTVALGRSIPPKMATPGVEFVWYDEDGSI